MKTGIKRYRAWGDESGLSLRNSLFASLLTVIGLAAGAGVFFMLNAQTKANAAGMTAQAVVAGIVNAYGSTGGYPSTVNFSTLQQQGNFPSNGQPNNATAYFSWGNMQYTGKNNNGANFNLKIQTDTSGECVSIAKTLVPMANTLKIGSTTIVQPGQTANASTIPTACAPTSGSGGSSGSIPAIAFTG